MTDWNQDGWHQRQWSYAWAAAWLSLGFTCNLTPTLPYPQETA